MINFQWCQSGCNRYHDRRDWPAAHYAMVVRPADEPNDGNFPGTPEELERFIVQLRVSRRDRERADDKFEARVDAELARQAVGPRGR